MTTQFEQIKKHKAQRQIQDFYRSLDQYLPRLRKYVRYRIKTLEFDGKLPKNYYLPEDVIAEVYLKIYERFHEIENEKQLKLKLFQIADEIIQNYVDQHKKPYKKIPVDEILKEELKILDESFTVDADGDLVLIEELDDISYKQDQYKRKIYLFDKEAERQFARVLGLDEKDFEEEKFRAVFGNLYASLPETTRRILDLIIHGDLTTEEAAWVAGVEESDVAAVLERIKIILTR